MKEARLRFSEFLLIIAFIGLMTAIAVPNIVRAHRQAAELARIGERSRVTNLEARAVTFTNDGMAFGGRFFTTNSPKHVPRAGDVWSLQARFTHSITVDWVTVSTTIPVSPSWTNGSMISSDLVYRPVMVNQIGIVRSNFVAVLRWQSNDVPVILESHEIGRTNRSYDMNWGPPR